MPSNGDWLYSVGVDTTKATADIKAFKDLATEQIGKIPNITLKLNTTQALEQVAKLGSEVSKITKLPQFDIKINLGGASTSLRNFAEAIDKTGPRLTKFSDLLMGISKSMTDYGIAVDKIVAQDKVWSESIVATSNNLRTLQATANNVAASANNLAASSNRLGNASANGARGIRSQGDALNFLQRVAQNTVFKFIEYQVIMEGFNAVMGELGSAIRQAADTQIESTLTGLYSKSIDVNRALSDSIVLAKQWGDNIVDVQQTIGVWTKVTNDLTTATYLANEALKLHVASGISTNDVTTTTISLMSKLHFTVGQLPQVYDQITKGAELLGQVMKNVGEASGKQEGMRDILEGATESASSLQKLGLDTSGSIAMIMAQVQGLGESGKEAGQKLSTMLSGLLANKSGDNFRAIVGPYKDLDELMDKLKEKAPELADAIAHGFINVRPSARETLNTILSMTDQIKKWGDAIKNNSNGALDVAASKMMDTFNQKVAQMQASLQAFTITLGTAMLPTATAFVQWLGGSLFPALQANIPMMERLATDVLHLAEVFGGMMVAARVPAILAAIQGAMSTLSVIAGTTGVAIDSIGVAMNTTAGTTGTFEAAMTSAGTAIKGVALALPGLIGLVSTLAVVGNMLIDGWTARSEASQRETQQWSANPYNSRIAADQAALNGQQLDVLGAADPRTGLRSVTKGATTYGRYAGPGGKLFYQTRLAQDQKLAADYARDHGQGGDYNTILQGIMDRMKAGLNIPGQEPPGSSGGAGTPPKGYDAAVTPEQQVRDSVETVKRDYQSWITAHQDAQTAAAEDVQTQHKLAEAFGYTGSRIKELSAAWNEEAAQVKIQQGLAYGEVRALEQKKAAAEKVLATLKPGTTGYANVAKSIDFITDAITKADGAAHKYDATYKLLLADAREDVDLARVKAAMQSTRVSNGAGGTVSLAGLESQSNLLGIQANSTKGAYNNATAEQSYYNWLTNTAIPALNHQIQSLGNVSDSAKKPLTDLLNLLMGKSDETQGKIATDNNDLVNLMTTLQEKIGDLTDKNAENIAGILGVSSDQVTYLKDMLSSWREIADIQKEIQTVENSGDVDAVQKVAALQQQLEVYTQISQIVAQEKAFEQSSVFKATNSVLGKYLGGALDSGIDKAFSVNHNKGGSNSPLRMMAVDWVKSIADEWLKSTVQAFTKGALNSPEKQHEQVLAKLYTFELQGLTKITADQKKNVQDTATAISQWIAFNRDSLIPALTGHTAATTAATGGGNYQNNPYANPNLAVPTLFGDFNTPNDIGDAIMQTAQNTANTTTATSNLGDSLASFATSVAQGGGGGFGGPNVSGFSALGGLSSLSSSIFGGLGKGFGGDLTALLGTLGIGTGIGGAIGGDASSNRTWGGLGAIAGVGTVAAISGGLPGLLALAATPGGALYIALAAVLGGTAGGLFGNHEQAWQQPDVSNTGPYGKFVSNLNGAPGTFNGTVIGPNSQFSLAAGHQDEAQQLFAWLQGNHSNLSQADQNEISQLKKLERGSSNPNALGIASERQGIFTLKSGAQISVTSYEQLVNSVAGLMGNKGGGTAPLISINAYGAGPGYKASLYNTPGLTSQQYQAVITGIQNGNLNPWPGSAAYYGTPGIGNQRGIVPIHPVTHAGVGSGYTTTANITLLLDGAVLARVVQSYINDLANRAA